MNCSQYIEISPQKPEADSEEENQLNIPVVYFQMPQVQAEMEIMPAVQDIQEMLDRLPSVAEVTDLNAAEQDTVYAEVQNAYATLEQLDEDALAKQIALSALLVDVAAVYDAGNMAQCA